MKEGKSDETDLGRYWEPLSLSEDYSELLCTLLWTFIQVLKVSWTYNTAECKKKMWTV